MVLDLEVEVAHPPVAQRRVLDVGGVHGGVHHPVQVVGGGGHGEVRVAHGEVDEDVVARRGEREQVQPQRARKPVPGERHSERDTVRHSERDTVRHRETQ